MSDLGSARKSSGGVSDEASDGALDQLVKAVVSGDATAWPVLAERLLPVIERIARSHQGLRRRGLAASSDEIAEVVTQTLERLTRHAYRNLEKYLGQSSVEEGKRPQTFDSWLYGVVDFTIREHLRARYGRAPAPDAARAVAQPSKRDLGTLAGRLDAEPERAALNTLGITQKLTLREILEHIELHFKPQEAQAMRLYYAEEKSFEEVAAALGLAGAEQAEKLVRKLNARLRYRFLGKPAPK